MRFTHENQRPVRANDVRADFTQHFGCYRRSCTSVFACIQRIVAIVCRPRELSALTNSGNLHIDALRTFLNLLEAEKCAFTCSWAGIAHLFPGGRTFQVRIPKRPGATLNRSRPINSALSSLRIEKSAVPVCKLG